MYLSYSPFSTCPVALNMPTHGTPVGKCLALRTHKHLLYSSSKISNKLCSRGSSGTSFCCCCCSVPAALSDSGWDDCSCSSTCVGSCYSGSLGPPSSGFCCSASAPGSRLPPVSIECFVVFIVSSASFGGCSSISAAVSPSGATVCSSPAPV